MIVFSHGGRGDPQSFLWLLGTDDPTSRGTESGWSRCWAWPKCLEFTCSFGEDEMYPPVTSHRNRKPFGFCISTSVYQRVSEQIVILFGKMMIPIKIWRISPTKSDKTHMDRVGSAPALQEWCQRQILQKQLVWHLWQAYVIWAHHLIFPTIETQDGRCRDDIPIFLLVTSDLQWPSHRGWDDLWARAPRAWEPGRSAVGELVTVELRKIGELRIRKLLDFVRFNL